MRTSIMNGCIFLVFQLLVVGLLATSSGCARAGGFPAQKGGNGDTEVDRGVTAFNNGQFEVAVERFKSALQKGVRRHPQARVQTMLGNAYNELGRLEESIAAHKEALRLDPQDHKAWNNLGVSYRLQGEFAEAAKCYEKALELNPDYAEGLCSHGVLLFLSDQPDKAIVSLEKAIKIDPSLAVASGNLALAYASVGRFDDADRQLKRAATLGYKNVPAISERIEALKALRPTSESE